MRGATKRGRDLNYRVDSYSAIPPQVLAGKPAPGRGPDTAFRQRREVEIRCLWSVLRPKNEERLAKSQK